MPVKKSRKLVNINKGSSLSTLLDAIVDGILEKKGEDVVSIDIKHIQNNIAENFIICHAESKPQILAIADSIEEQVLKSTGEKPISKEGYTNCEWLILDYFNVVVHIFQKDKRDFYGLERLWADGIVRNMAGK